MTTYIYDLHYKYFPHENWTLGKNNLSEFSTSTNLSEIKLRFDKLNLSFNEGFNDLNYKASLVFNKVSFDLQLTDDAFMAIEVHKKDSASTGVRLSTNKTFPPLFYLRNIYGKYSHSKQNVPILEEGKYKIEIYLSKTDIILKIGTNSYSFERNEIKNFNHLSLRGGDEDAYISNLKLFSDNQLVYKDNFNASYVKLALVILASFFLLLTLTIKYQKQLLLTYFSNLYLIFSITYILNQSLFNNLLEIISSKIDASIHNSKSYHSFYEIIKRDNLKIEEKDFNIALFGGSSIFGIGATNKDNTIPRLLSKLLSSEKVSLYSYAIPGATVSYHVKHTRDNNLGNSKHLAIVIFGYNDLSYQKPFMDTVNSLKELASLYNGNIIFVEEPIATYLSHEDYISYHKQVRDALGMKVYTLSEILSKFNSTGELWIDNVHMTSYGQSLMSKELEHLIISFKISTRQLNQL